MSDDPTEAEMRVAAEAIGFDLYGDASKLTRDQIRQMVEWWFARLEAKKKVVTAIVTQEKCRAWTPERCLRCHRGSVACDRPSYLCGPRAQ